MKYIFESPDKGRTIYRRVMGTTKRELVSDTEPDVIISEEGVVFIEDGVKGGLACSLQKL
jgi:hypothetical protein